MRSTSADDKSVESTNINVALEEEIVKLKQILYETRLEIVELKIECREEEVWY